MKHQWIVTSNNDEQLPIYDAPGSHTNLIGYLKSKQIIEQIDIVGCWIEHSLGWSRCAFAPTSKCTLQLMKQGGEQLTTVQR
jgi:hypothetical protein